MVEFGDSLKQMADVKYSLDDNVKQNFLEPLHQLQMKDLKEVMVRSKWNELIEIKDNDNILNSKLVYSIIVKNCKDVVWISIVNVVREQEVKCQRNSNTFFQSK